MNSPQSKAQLLILGRSLGGWVLSRAAILATVVLVIATVSPPLYGQESTLNAEALAHRLAAIEETNPFHLRDLVRNDRPTLIAFIDHLCFTCLRSVGTVEKLKLRFSDLANIAVIDRYRVWFVPKFVILDKHGDLAKEYFGFTPARTLASDIQSLLAR